MEMLHALGFPAPGDDTFVFICGPPPYHEYLREVLAEHGYQKDENFN
jgi:ferredoxin-NADP reductase